MDGLAKLRKIQLRRFSSNLERKLLSSAKGSVSEFSKNKDFKLSRVIVSQNVRKLEQHSNNKKVSYFLPGQFNFF